MCECDTVSDLAHQLLDDADDNKPLGGDTRIIFLATLDVLCDTNSKKCFPLDIAKRLLKIFVGWDNKPIKLWQKYIMDC